MARIRRVRVRSYKSFADTEDVTLSPRFTVVVGRNNGGKTALLQAIAGKISLHTSPWRHPDASSHAMSHVRRLTPEEVRYWRSLTPSERLDLAMEMSAAASKERARQPPKRWRTVEPR